MSPTIQLAGIVLAGGASSRMGRDKATLQWGDKTFLARIVESLRPVCAEVFVVIAPKQKCPEVSATLVRDPIAHRGPLHGLLTGLDAARQAGHHWAFVCATDMPLVSARLVRELAPHCVGEALDVVLAHDGARAQPLASIYRTAAAVTMRAHADAGGRSMYGALSELRTSTVDVTRCANELINVNTPDELTALRPPQAAREE